MPAASERTPISIVLTCRHPFGPRHLPVWATMCVLQPSLLATQPTCWHCQRKAWTGTPTNQGHPLASSHSKNLLPVGPVLVGPQAPSLGCDQSAVSGATDGGRESSTFMGCDQSAVSGVASVIESGLDSSKVTHLLDHTGLVEGAHLLAASPGWPISEGLSLCDSSYAFYFLSALYFLTASNCPIAPAIMLPMRNRVAQVLHVSL